MVTIYGKLYVPRPIDDPVVYIRQPKLGGFAAVLIHKVLPPLFPLDHQLISLRAEIKQCFLILHH
jgi:hypothetical protein